MAVDDNVRDYSLLEDGTFVRCYAMSKKDDWILGHVESVHDKKISIKFRNQLKNILRLASTSSSTLFGVVFYNGRTTFQMEHTALEVLKDNRVDELLFPTANTERVPNSRVLKFSEIYNKNIDRNLEFMAVRHIVGNTAYPLPYIIYGPPGTGKTTTIVEAILQIHHGQPNSSILVAATTNSACDTITAYLLNYIDKGLLRLYGELVMRDIDCLNEKIRAVSNIQDGGHQFPGKSDLCRFRIIVATVTTCGRLLQGNMTEEYFTHIFVDECGSVREPSAMIPICLGTSKNSVKASIILAGDPNQLGPVIYSQLGKSLKFDQSYLERLMKMSIYKKNLATGRYDNTLITKLKKNYRSHPQLIHLSNRLFYDGEIEACGDERIIYALQNQQYQILVNRAFPITLDATYGNTQNNANSTSLYNMVEVNKIVLYLGRIMEVIENHPDLKPLLRNIGIISPYRKQVAKIKDACEPYKDDLDIEVGSVEQFQGKEKVVIILSTVRSHMPSVGFLDSAKRFNVAMTRAKCLLIVIGNPNTLSLDRNWRELVEYCDENASRNPSSNTRNTRRR